MLLTFYKWEARMAGQTVDERRQGEASVLRAVVALLADEREARIANDKGARSTEALLDDVGFSTVEIADLLGKNYRTVQSTLRRNKAK
jgi:DNA-directed RNA polymerase specialized sigma24 family protein